MGPVMHGKGRGVTTVIAELRLVDDAGLEAADAINDAESHDD